MDALTVGVVQATPVFFDLSATLDRVEDWLQQAQSAGCQLVLFPESFIPGYPRGFTFGSTIGRRSDEGRELYQKYWDNSISVPGEACDRLAAMAKEYNVYLTIGVTERDSINGTLYCSLLYYSPKVGLLGKHRKLKPTGVERLVWGEGNADTLISIETEIGRIGGLICWENYMPLARMTMYEAGVQIYLAPTADARKSWTTTMQHIALEGRCFVLGCNQFFRKQDYPEAYRAYVETEPDDFCRGGSLIIGPDGKLIEGPLHDQQGLLVAQINLAETVRHKLDFDVTGHYARPDVFHFTVTPPPPVIKESNLLNSDFSTKN
ncbi:MAG: carbon-nitrogen hydrolase family protein [Cyclobacteriaceae bacterium]